MILKALNNARKALGNKVEYRLSIEKCSQSSDLSILATEWPSLLQKFMKPLALLNCRRTYDPEKFEGIKFAAIGLSPRLTHSDKFKSIKSKIIVMLTKPS